MSTIETSFALQVAAAILDESKVFGLGDVSQSLWVILTAENQVAAKIALAKDGQNFPPKLALVVRCNGGLDGALASKKEESVASPGHGHADSVVNPAIPDDAVLIVSHSREDDNVVLLSLKVVDC